MNVFVIIEGNVFKYSETGRTPGGARSLQSGPVNADGTVSLRAEDFSGEIEPVDMTPDCFAADRALHALHNDSHLAAYVATL